MLGDENNNDLIDLSSIDRAKCALLVIDELGDPTGGPLEPVLLPAIQQTAKLTTAARAAGMPVVFTNDAHIPGIDRELALWGTHGIAGTPRPRPRRCSILSPPITWWRSAATADFSRRGCFCC